MSRTLVGKNSILDHRHGNRVRLRGIALKKKEKLEHVKGLWFCWGGCLMSSQAWYAEGFDPQSFFKLTASLKGWQDEAHCGLSSVGQRRAAAS